MAFVASPSSYIGNKGRWTQSRSGSSRRHQGKFPVEVSGNKNRVAVVAMSTIGDRIMQGIEEFVYGKEIGEILKGKREEQESVLDKIPSEGDVPCPCGSGSKYKSCCQPFHIGDSLPNALQLLRSRYSAYYYRLPSYIMKTTHEKNEDFVKSRRIWKGEITDFCMTHRFLSLEILEQKITRADTQFIMFRVSLLHEGVPASFIEQSKLQQDAGKWWYLSGRLVDFEVSEI